jgi:hypothetical protein
MGKHDTEQCIGLSNEWFGEETSVRALKSGKPEHEHRPQVPCRCIPGLMVKAHKDVPTSRVDF